MAHAKHTHVPDSDRDLQLSIYTTLHDKNIIMEDFIEIQHKNNDNPILPGIVPNPDVSDCERGRASLLQQLIDHWKHISIDNRER